MAGLRFRYAASALLALAGIGAGVAAVAQSTAAPSAAPSPAFADAGETARAMAQARKEGEAARRRAEQLEAQATQVTQQAERTARQAAAVAARIQQTEAQVSLLEGQTVLIARDRARLRARLAERQQPLIRLTAALQRLSRRPPVLALLRPGSIDDTVHMRALLTTLLPQVEQRTAALREEIAQARRLQDRARQSAQALRASEGQLREQRRNLAAIESRQRLASRQAMSTADREAERALALAEQARDLGGLMRDLDEAGRLRAALARLPGPISRPARPEDARVTATEAPVEVSDAPPGYMLPVAGRLVSGFAADQGGGARSRGIALATRPGAQVVAPAGGRVAFAGPFRGFGRIVIVEHEGGWTSLVTGLAELDARVGDRLVGGSPLGVAGPGSPVVSLELRRDGTAVNPLQFIATL
ncbi:MAG: peptidoglycan DD-metalloendopeptidase family protein [Novosphingobium sp.]|nr:peptidoglycan DD-metalloendopeptidase family protein [Novosphingobium sp.]